MSNLTTTVLLWIPQATLVLAIGLAAAFCCRRRAAVAHAVLLLSLGVVLILPLADWAVARAGAGMLPSRAVASATSNVAAATPQLPPLSTPRTSEPASPAARGGLGNATMSAATDPIPSPGAPASSSGLPSLSLAAIAIFAWLLLSAAMFVRLFWSIVRAIRLRHRSEPCTQAAPLEALRAVRRELAVDRSISLHTSRAAPCPMICCWGTPCILIPQACPADVDWRAVMAHELAHLIRRDHLSALLAELVCALFPWNPFAWLARRQLAVLSEQACDDWALRSASSQTSYAETLVAFVRHGGLPLAPAFVSRGGVIARVTRVLAARRGNIRIGRTAAASIAVTAIGLVALAALAQPATKPSSAPSAPKGAKLAPPRPEDAAADKSSYADRLAALNDSDWRGASALGKQIAGLPPEQGWAIMRDNWARVPSIQARQQLIKSWFFGDTFPLNPRSHPHVLDVLDLGMRDPSPLVQKWSMDYLKGVAFEDFALDFTVYEEWWKKHHGRPIADVRIDCCRDWVARIKAIKTDEEFKSLAEFMSHMGYPFRDAPALAAAALNAGIIEAIEPWLNKARQDASLESPASRALSAVDALPIDRARIDRVVVPLLAKGTPSSLRGSAARVLGKPENAWALPLLLDALKDTVPAAGGLDASDIATALATMGDAAAIPTMIAVIDSNNKYETVYGVGYFGLSNLTGVKYDETHDGPWWRDWWEKNKARYPEAVRNQPIPDLPRAAPAAKPAKAAVEPDAASDVADIPFQDLRIGGDENKRYFLIGPRPGAKAPAAGYRLLLMLPGGDGSADFRPFVQRILKNAAADDVVIAQLVAPKWSEDKDRIVWPTRTLKDERAKFPTEDFLASVIDDAKTHLSIDGKRVDALGWSSGGPPVYASAMAAGSRVRGAFVAMSVFKPESLPPAAGAAGRRFYLLHSPQDFIPMTFPRDAEKTLKAAGAKATLATYEGGHGWRGDVFSNIRAGLEWLDKTGD